MFLKACISEQGNDATFQKFSRLHIGNESNGVATSGLKQDTRPETKKEVLIIGICAFSNFKLQKRRFVPITE